MSPTTHRILRFLWLLARGPLKLLAGVAGGCAILAALYFLGQLTGATLFHFAMGAMWVYAVLFWTVAALGLIAGACWFCRWVREQWRNSFQP